MNITRWVSFAWELGKTELPELAAPRHYRIELVGPEDEEILRAVIAKSLALDPSWNSTLREASAIVTNSITRALGSETTLRLVLRHGRRIIGATLLAPQANALEQFVPGPCVLMEYRNRGLGTLLLGAALRQLRESGTVRARAITRDGSPVARFVYPKFGGTSAPIAPLLAA